MLPFHKFYAPLKNMHKKVDANWNNLTILFNTSFFLMLQFHIFLMILWKLTIHTGFFPFRKSLHSKKLICIGKIMPLPDFSDSTWYPGKSRERVSSIINIQIRFWSKTLFEYVHDFVIVLWVLNWFVVNPY